MATLINLLKSLRPQQWIKNILIFAGLIFAKKLFEPQSLFKSIAAFFLFSFVTGAVYILNDLKDLPFDKIHPQKKNRPIASGKVDKNLALIFALLLLSITLVFSYLLAPHFFAVVLLYLILTTLYSLYLKNIVILDVMSIALGFLLRAWAGAVVISVSLSEWLFICTILLALFLALTKRKVEMRVLDKAATNHRYVLNHYSHDFLDQMIGVATAAAVIAYALYTVAPETTQKFETKNLVLTMPFVLYGIFRYLYLIYRKEFGDNPERAFIKDLPLLLNICLWLLAVIFIIYFRRL